MAMILIVAARCEIVGFVSAQPAVRLMSRWRPITWRSGLNVYWAAMEARRRAVDAVPTTSGYVPGKRRIAGGQLS